MPVRVAEPLLGGEQVRPGQVPAQLAGDPLSRLIPVGPGLQRAAYRGDEPGQPGAGLSGDEGHRSSCDLTQLNRMVVTSPDCPTLTGRRMIGRGSGPGVVMTPERRHALLAWARDRYAIVIEDDYDSEFRYDREPIGTLQGLAPDRVALLGSVSKSLAPALRLGWIACPPQLSGPLAHGKRYNDRGCPALDHLALAALIESGRFDRHVRRMRALYAARRDALGRTLRAHAPSVAADWPPACTPSPPCPVKPTSRPS